MERGTNPDLAFASVGQDNRLLDRRVLGSSRSHNTDPLSQRHWVSKFLHTSIRWSVGTFARLIGNAFAFLQVNPLTDCRLRTQQTSRRRNKIFARVRYLLPNNASHVAAARTMCHAGTKSATLSIAPTSEPQWGLRATSSLLFRLEQKKRNKSDGRKLSMPSTSRTPAARRGGLSMHSLAGPDAPLACVQSRRTPAPGNSWRTEHIWPGSGSLPGSSTRSCPIYERSQHQRVIVFLILLD